VMTTKNKLGGNKTGIRDDLYRPWHPVIMIDRVTDDDPTPGISGSSRSVAKSAPSATVTALRSWPRCAGRRHRQSGTTAPVERAPSRRLTLGPAPKAVRCERSMHRRRADADLAGDLRDRQAVIDIPFA
jgi:hypothetical protein